MAWEGFDDLWKAGFAALVGGVGWTVKSVVRHDKDLAVMTANQDDIKEALARIEKAVEGQRELCTTILSQGNTPSHRGH